MPSPTKQQQIERDASAILKRPFSAADLEWKLFATTYDKTSGRIAPYLTARAVQDRLNEALGPFGWSTDQVMGDVGIMLGLTCHIGDKSITRWGEAGYTAGGGDADPGGVKGGASNAFKRAGSKFEIGEYLYHLPDFWVPVEQMGNSDKYRMTADGPRIAMDKFPEWARPPQNGGSQTSGKAEREHVKALAPADSSGNHTSTPKAEPRASSANPADGREADYKRRLDLAGERADTDGLTAIVRAMKLEFGIESPQWERLFSRYEKHMFEIDEREGTLQHA